MSKLISTIKKNFIPYQLDDNWTWYKWGDLIESYQQGLIRSNSELNQESGIEYFKMNFISEDGSYTFNSLPRTFATNEEIEKFKINSGDFFINVRNSKELVGKSCVVYGVDRHILFNHMLVRIKHQDYISGSFVNAYLNTNFGKKLLDTCKKGTTTVVALYQKDIYELPVPIPNKVLLESIDSIYNNINKKIEINNRINAELEQMAKTLYSYWFVQFDFPNEDGKPYKSSGGKMFYDEGLQKEIPDSWVIKPLSKINSELVRGISPKYSEDNGIPVVNQRCIRNSTVDFSFCRLHNVQLKPVNRLIQVGDILVNSTGVGTLGRVAVVKRLENPETTVDSHVTIVRANIEQVNPHFLGFSLLDKQKEIEKLGEGSTGQTELSRVNLGKLKMLLPKRELQNEFASIVKPLLEKAAVNEQQNQQLSSLRNWLLPMLMNGQVKVGEAAENLSMAAEPEMNYGR